MPGEGRLWVSIDWSQKDGSISNLWHQISQRDFDSLVSDFEELRWTRVWKGYWVHENTNEEPEGAKIPVTCIGRDGIRRGCRGRLRRANTHGAQTIVAVSPPRLRRSRRSASWSSQMTPEARPQRASEGAHGNIQRQGTRRAPAREIGGFARPRCRARLPRIGKVCRSSP